MSLVLMAKLISLAQFALLNRNIQSPSVTSSFSNYLGADIPISKLRDDIHDLVQFHFFHNNFAYKDIIDVEIFLRQTIKCDYAFMESLSPLDLLAYFARAMEIEEARKDALDAERKESLSRVR